MVVIRLAPFGKKKATIYKVTVASKGAKLSGKFLEKLGTYAPAKGKNLLEVNMDRLNYWIGVGAQPSPRLKKVLATYYKGPKVEVAPKAAAPAAPKTEKKAAPAAKKPAARKA